MNNGNLFEGLPEARISYIECRGNRQQTGEQYGEAARSEIADEIAAVVKIHGEKLQEFAGKAENALRRFAPEILEELAGIRRLAAEKNLCVGLMLPLWSSANAQTARRLIADGSIGEVQSVVFTGHHPLNYGVRADWYWQEDMHGGTINDIAPHGIDLVEYITGMKFGDTVCSRCWNDHFPEVPHFKNGAQFMSKLENGAGVMADVSYFACHFGQPSYWRFNVWGTNGWLEFVPAVPGVKFTEKSSTVVKYIYPENSGTDYLQEFLLEIDGGVPAYFSTGHVLDITETALKIQAAADK